jgi:iron complex outermembrane receptor protein
MKGLNWEVNGFYNRAEDLIQTTITYYKNDVRNQTCGVELMASYKQPKFTANWNLTWTHTFKSNLIDLMELGLSKEFTDQYSSSINANNNTPTVMSNLVV